MADLGYSKKQPTVTYTRYRATITDVTHIDQGTGFSEFTKALAFDPPTIKMWDYDDEEWVVVPSA